MGVRTPHAMAAKVAMVSADSNSIDLLGVLGSLPAIARRATAGPWREENRSGLCFLGVLLQENVRRNWPPKITQITEKALL